MATVAHQPLSQQQQRCEDDRVEALVAARLQERLAAQLRDVADVVLECRLDGCFSSVLESAALMGKHELLGALVKHLQKTRTINAGRASQPDICRDISAAWRAAAYQGHPECLQVLLDSCTSPASVAKLLDVRDREEYGIPSIPSVVDHTALMIAAMQGHVDCIQLLLHHNPDSQVAAVADHDHTALMMAAAGGNAECVRLLLNHSPETQVAAEDGDGCTALMYAADGGDTDCLQLLLAYSPISHVAAVGTRGTAIKIAAGYGMAKCLKLLLPHSPSRQQLDQALLAACQRLACESARHIPPEDKELVQDVKQLVLDSRECLELLLAAGALLPAEATEGDKEALRPINQQLTAKARVPDMANEAVVGLAKAATNYGHKRLAREEDAAAGSSKCARPSS